MSTPKTGCWFSFGPDALCLRESVEQWRESTSGWPVAIFDEVREPLPADVLRALAPDHYERTPWERRRNLNGWSAVFGILDSIHRAGMKLGTPGAFKIDCDTLVLDPSWGVDHLDYVGLDMGGVPLGAGPAYYLSTGAALKLRESFQARKLWDARVPEDWTISAEAIRLLGPAATIRHWQERVVAEWDYTGTVDPERYRGISVVTFGRRSAIRCKKCERREFAALAMAKWRKEVRRG